MWRSDLGGFEAGKTVYDVMLRRPNGTQYSRTFTTKKEAESWQAQPQGLP